jgi:hypothetical protein
LPVLFIAQTRGRRDLPVITLLAVGTFAIKAAPRPVTLAAAALARLA